MHDYQVSYYIGDMYHSYVVEAKDEEHAQAKVEKSAPRPELIKWVGVELWFAEWN